MEMQNTTAERETRYNRLIHHLGVADVWSARYDETTDEWIIESESDAKYFDGGVDDAEITVWIVQNLFDEIPF